MGSPEAAFGHPGAVTAPVGGSSGSTPDRPSFAQDADGRTQKDEGNEAADQDVRPSGIEHPHATGGHTISTTLMPKG